MDGTKWILGDLMKIRLDHIGIAVNTISEGSEFWRILGLSQGRDERNEEQGVDIRFFNTAGSENGPRIELLEPLGEDTPIGRFLDKRGQGIQQVAFEVEDLDSLLIRLKAEGIRLINEVPANGSHGSRIVFVHPSSTGGVLVELLQYD